MIINEKWEVIRFIGICIICVFGMVTCHGIDTYRGLREKELQVDQLKAEATKAEAEAARARILTKSQ